MEGERWPLPRSVQVVKIALYTIFRCTNYGAVLQAYALARILRDILGVEFVPNVTITILIYVSIIVSDKRL